MGLALLFPGQGAQHPDMLPWLYGQAKAQPMLQRLEQQLGQGWHDRLADASWAHANAVAQPLVTGISLAAWDVLAPSLPAPSVIAGYSVGELAAFTAAGVLPAEGVLALSADRAQFMAEAAEGLDSCLMAVQGSGALAAVQSCTGSGAEVFVAIRINEDRVIAGGVAQAVQTCAQGWQQAGLRCSRLPVAVASHTPILATASTAFAKRLGQMSLGVPRAAVVCNLTGSASRSPAQLATALAGQICHTVKWDECMDAIAERGARCVLEVGPGAALAGMWRERHPRVPVRSTDEFQGPDGVAEWVRSQLARA